MRRPPLASLGLAVLVATFLVPAMARAYRTAGELPEFAGTDRVRWDRDIVPVVMHLDGAPGVSLASAEREVLLALGRWSAPTCTDLGFRYDGAASAAPASGDGRNTIAWVTADWEWMGFPPNAAGATDTLYERDASGEWRIVEGDIHLNAAQYAWSTTSGATDSSIRSVASVLTHEVGHFLGLLHCCEPDGFEGAPLCSTDPTFLERTMYPLYTGPAQADLSADDEVGLCFLYPRPDCALTGCPEAHTCTPDGCAPLCGDAVCAADEHCVGDECLPSRCLDPTCLGAACLTGADCPGLICLAGACTPPGAQLGDSCVTGADCRGGLCTHTGYCTTACTGACPDGYECVAAPSDDPHCVSLGGVLGDACTMGEECASRICLLAHRSHCTRVCTEAGPCPDGFACAEVDGQDVCRRTASGTGGCSLASASENPPLSFFTFLLLGAGILGRRRRSPTAANSRP